MPLTRAFVLLALISSSASAQATTRPTTAVPGTVVRPAGPDLLIDDLNVKLLPGLGSGITVEGNAVKVGGLVLTAHVTNVGTERWASQGAVALTLRLGIEGDAMRQGASVVPAATSVLGRLVAQAAPFGPFHAAAPVPGSLAPGESRDITVVVRNGAGGAFLIFERDKYYTVDAVVTASRDVAVGNNRSVRVGRFNANAGQLVTQWEPIAYRSGAAGTVQVNAPPRP